MTKKRIIIGGIVLVLLMATVYGWYQYNRTVQTLSNVDADFSVNATALINEFVSNEDSANKKYLNRILSVKGMIKNYFNGSALQFASFFTRATNLTQVELESLKKIVEAELKNKKK